MARFAHWETGEGFTKKERMRLAKAELIMTLAGEAGQWAKEVGNRPGSRMLPFEEWTKLDGSEDSLRLLARTYGLTGEDLGKLLDKIADDLEWKAIRSGYDEHWDPAPPDLRGRGRRKGR